MNRWFGSSRWSRCSRPGRGAGLDRAARPPPRLRAGDALAGQEALDQARANSPAYRQTLNDAGPARWGVRNAYGSLLPSVNVSSDCRAIPASGQSNFGGGFIQPTSAFVTSSYNVGPSVAARRPDAHRPGAAEGAPAGHRRGHQRGRRRRCGRRSTTQYLTTLQAAAQVGGRPAAGHAERRLPDARQGALPGGPGHPARRPPGRGHQGAERRGAAPRGAGGERGQARPAAPDGRRAAGRRSTRSRSPTRFPVTAPAFQLDSLLALAERAESVARARSGRGGRRPRSASAPPRASSFPRSPRRPGWSGFTQQFTDENFLMTSRSPSAQAQAASCQSNNADPRRARPGGTLGLLRPPRGSTPAAARCRIRWPQQIRDAATTSSPSTTPASRSRPACRISLPIFTGFGRSLRLSQARAQRGRRRRERAGAPAPGPERRARPLPRPPDLVPGDRASRRPTARRRATSSGWRRTATGSAPAPSLEVSDAQNAVQQAEGDYVNAIYDYHKAIAALEAAVGRPLR